MRFNNQPAANPPRHTMEVFRMKRFSFLAFLFFILIVAAAARAEEVYEVDPVHTFASFKVGHLGISYVRGVFPDISGQVVVNSENSEESSAGITIAVKSVDTNNGKRDAHLRTADFFDVEKYPEMSFKSTKVERTGEDTAKVKGDFTLHGTTKTIEVDVTRTGEGEDPWGGYRIGFETKFEIKRSEYGMDKMIPTRNRLHHGPHRQGKFQPCGRKYGVELDQLFLP